MTLFWRDGDPDSLVLEGRVVDPAAGTDETLTVTVDNGVIARIEPGGDGRLVLAPAFVDPHVHLRTPGREDTEDIASGSRAASTIFGSISRALTAIRISVGVRSAQCVTQPQVGQ